MLVAEPFMCTQRSTESSTGNISDCLTSVSILKNMVASHGWLGSHLLELLQEYILDLPTRLRGLSGQCLDHMFQFTRHQDVVSPPLHHLRLSIRIRQFDRLINEDRGDDVTHRESKEDGVKMKSG